MRLVCGECKKVYNYDVDDFCPRCGAYNPPKKQWRVDATGNVVRVDGVNEADHKGSFVHKEVHREKAVRRVVGLDRDEGAKVQRRKPAASRPSVPRNEGKRTGQGGSVIRAFVAIVFLLQFLRACMDLY